MTHDVTIFYCQECRTKSEEVCPQHGPAKVLLGVEMLYQCGPWGEDHEHCPGLRDLGRGVVLCTCTCHLTSADWFKINHYFLGEAVDG